METPNYKENAVAGSQWQRVKQVLIENPLPDASNPGAVPSILLVEEEVILVGGRAIKTTVANLSATFDQANPLHVEIYTKINELYILLREARDAQAAAAGGAV